MLQAEIFEKKPCGNWEIDTFSCFGVILYVASVEGFDWKMQIFGPHDPEFWPAPRPATATFSISTNDWSLIMRLLDSWHHGASAGLWVDYTGIVVS